MIQPIPLTDRILNYYYDKSNNHRLKHIGYINGTPFNCLDDAIQESAMNAVIKQDTYDPTRPLENWLNTIFLNKCIDLQRKKRVRREFSETEQEEYLNLPSGFNLLDNHRNYELSPEQYLIEEDRKRIIRKAVSTLSPNLQKIITEHYFNGRLKQREIADKLGIPIGTVKSRLHFAIENLRALLTPYKEELMFG